MNEVEHRKLPRKDDFEEDLQSKKRQCSTNTVHITTAKAISRS